MAFSLFIFCSAFTNIACHLAVLRLALLCFSVVALWAFDSSADVVPLILLLCSRNSNPANWRQQHRLCCASHMYMGS